MPRGCSAGAECLSSIGLRTRPSDLRSSDGVVESCELDADVDSDVPEAGIAAWASDSALGTFVSAATFGAAGEGVAAAAAAAASACRDLNRLDHDLAEAMVLGSLLTLIAATDCVISATGSVGLLSRTSGCPFVVGRLSVLVSLLFVSFVLVSVGCWDSVALSGSVFGASVADSLLITSIG